MYSIQCSSSYALLLVVVFEGIWGSLHRENDIGILYVQYVIKKNRNETGLNSSINC